MKKQNQYNTMRQLKKKTPPQPPPKPLFPKNFKLPTESKGIYSFFIRIKIKK